MQSSLYRVLDFSLALCGLIFLSPVFVVVYLLGKRDTGQPIFRQERVGRHQKPFTLVKFRTMPVETASVATHLVDASSVTKLGAFLRKTKLDELPQLINVVKGEMSLVGPRPCLFNQTELIEARQQRGVLNVLPGITGLAQINGVDMSTPAKLAEMDKEMIQTFNLKAYFAYILQTAIGRGAGDRIKSGNS
ncbi:sugar transferase [Photobacterium gaetbulicola]|uniref:Putative galactosyl-transferase n=1 Tax=Photobacterium gaetbulicola Gung47 TaxID=658445 RepID=A0A0C5WQQ8_9GAMM|nr:sugar transferase [Photobacterium gaetbulicola]AJR09513.1 putative galactosyl-transferase [Photobacterium gaetbulicola Gung47]PSU14308.1 sugar transferase [Photobacterium gaetbulicola]